MRITRDDGRGRRRRGGKKTLLRSGLSYAGGRISGLLVRCFQPIFFLFQQAIDFLRQREQLVWVFLFGSQFAKHLPAFSIFGLHGGLRYSGRGERYVTRESNV